MKNDERIPLSYHAPLMDAGEEHWPAELWVTTDLDSSIRKDAWISVSWTDINHDSDTFDLTFDEANQLRLALEEQLSVWLKREE